jgi:hypothetical protein
VNETRALTLRFEEEGRSASKASHAGIIRIGFEGISQPHCEWSTPVSMIRLKHSKAVERKPADQLPQRPRRSLHPSDFRRLPKFGSFLSTASSSQIVFFHSFLQATR